MIVPLLTLALLAPSAAPAQQASQTIEACDVHLTELGRRARFQASYIYRLSTGAEGRRAVLTPIKVEPGARFVDLASLESCIDRWQLSPNSSYVVVFNAGTSGDMYPNWILRIRDEGNPNMPALTILLPQHPHHS